MASRCTPATCLRTLVACCAPCCDRLWACLTRRWRPSPGPVAAPPAATGGPEPTSTLAVKVSDPPIVPVPVPVPVPARSSWVRSDADRACRLGDVVVKTSHNSYLATAQHLAVAGPSGLLLALQQGARCVELDVFWEPVAQQGLVAHGQLGSDGAFSDLFTTTTWSLTDALTCLVEHAWQETSDPLFLYLEVNVHDEDRAAFEAWLATTWEQCMPAARRWTGRCTDPAWRVVDATDRICLVTDKASAPTSPMHPYWNLTWDDPQCRNWSTDTAAVNVVQASEDLICRVYPSPSMRTVLSGNAVSDLLRPAWPHSYTFPAINMHVRDAVADEYHAWFQGAHLRRKGA